MRKSIQTLLEKGFFTTYKEHTKIIRKQNMIDYNRFYPHYGARSIRRNTNIYKNGKGRRNVKKETRIQIDDRYRKIFSLHNQSKNSGGGILK
jgi:hypothetical protein